MAIPLRLCALPLENPHPYSDLDCGFDFYRKAWLDFCLLYTLLGGYVFIYIIWLFWGLENVKSLLTEEFLPEVAGVHEALQPHF